MIHQKDLKKRRSEFVDPPPHLSLKSHLQNTPSRRPKSKTLLPWALWFIRSELQDRNRSTKTVDAVRDDLQKLVLYFYRKVPDGRIDGWSPAITTSLVNRLNHYKRSTQRRIQSSLMHFAGFLVRKGLIQDDDNPVRGLKRVNAEPPTPQSLQAVAADGDTVIEGDDVFDMLLETALQIEAQEQLQRSPRSLPLRDVALLHVLRSSGLRASEVTGLTVEQLKPHAKTGGAFFEEVTCKGGGTRAEVYIGPECLKHLHHYLRTERDSILKRSKTGDPHIFLSYRGNMLSRIDLQRIVKRISKVTVDREVKNGAASFAIKAHPHSFRHERVYALLRAGLTESETAREVGHKGTAYIGRYSNRSKDDRAERLKKVR